MSFRGYDAEVGDPFDNDQSKDPFGGAAVSTSSAPAAAPTGPSGEVSTLATLTVVFAFVFAPAGLVLGHVALSQIKQHPQPGHRRAVFGLTVSYVLTVLAIVALLAWLLIGIGRSNDSATAADTSAPPPSPSVRSTVVTPPAQSRPKVNVANLKVGDCVEIQKNQPDPNRPNTDQVYIYRARCEIRDGVFQVRQKGTNANECPPGEYLTNEQENIVACFVKYGQ
jgi:hypothetical protein